MNVLKGVENNMIWNYIICIISIAVMIVEVLFILKRNRKIQLKGKDDFFAFTLVVLFILVIFPLSEMDSFVENIRNILVLVAVFGTAGIKRGFSEKGMEKICFTVKWEDIQSIQIDPYQSSKIRVTCLTKSGNKNKLFFSKYKLKDVLRVCQKHISEVYIQNSLDEVLNMKDMSKSAKH